MNRSVYVAHPIDNAGAWHGANQKADLRRELARHDLWAYWPSQAWEGRSMPVESVRRQIALVNRTALEAADALVALLPEEVYTLGVPAEIQWALDQGKPALIWTNVEAVQVNEWVAQGADLVRESRELTEAIRELKLRVADQRATQVRFRSIGDQRLPTRAYPGDAGFDLYVSQDAAVHIGEYKEVQCDIEVEMPAGTWGLLHSRSSTMLRGLLVNTAVIDGGYRGDLFVGVRNIGPDVVHIKRGERIAQLIPMPLLAENMDAAFVDALSPSDRGVAGYGSSGK